MKDLIAYRNSKGQDWLGNTRQIPVVTNTFHNGQVIEIGNVKMKTDILVGHDIADAVFFIDKDPAIGIDRSLLMHVDVFFPGWIPLSVICCRFSKIALMPSQRVVAVDLY